MILTGNEIQKQIQNGAIVMEPFSESQITTNSYDLRLGNELLIYEDEIIDPKKKPNFKIIRINSDGYELKRGDFVLGSSIEKFGSTKFVPLIHAKSSTARLGLFVHVTADLIDIGWIGHSTFQLYATMPIKIYPGMLLGQVSFWKPKGKIVLYSGKYQNSSGPRVSEIYKDFSK